MQTRGDILEAKLTTVFRELRAVEEITEEKVSTEFMLNIVGSYLLSKDAGKLAEGYTTPARLFDERFIPIIDESDTTEEEIEDGIDTAT